MAFHCGAPTRDGSACQRHVREPGTRCSQHRNLGGAALRPPRQAMRTIYLADPALIEAPTAWTSARRDRATPPPDEESRTPAQGSLAEEEPARADATADAGAGADEVMTPVGPESEVEQEQEDPAPEAAQPEPADEPEPRPVEQRPQLRRERALDPDWIGARPLFRDEAPTRGMPRIEFEPSAGAEPVAPRRRPRIAAMQSVVLSPHADEVNGVDPQADPPTLVDPMPPIDPDDLVVPEWLRPDYIDPAAIAVIKPAAKIAPPSAPAPAPKPAPDPDPPTLIAPPPALSAPSAPPPPVAADGLTVPDFIVPGFSKPAPEPPLRTVLSTVLGPDLWQRCYTEWTPAHCTALARVARNVDGLAPSAGAAMRSTAGAGMRWLGVAREREMLADLVADAIEHPVGATPANQARTVRLYGAAICVALNVPLRRCACHRDLERDVSGELIRLGLAELAGEVP